MSSELLIRFLFILHIIVEIIDLIKQKLLLMAIDVPLVDKELDNFNEFFGVAGFDINDCVDISFRMGTDIADLSQAMKYFFLCGRNNSVETFDFLVKRCFGNAPKVANHSLQTSPLVKEWADMLLFANYKTVSVAVDDKGKKHKAQGGKRVMYTTHHPCWDAKNRHGFADQIEFNYAAIAHCIPDLITGSNVNNVQEEQVSPPEENIMPQPAEEQTVQEKAPEPSGSSPIKQLYDLMEQFDVSREEIQWAVSTKGYYPKSTPIERYEENFIAGVLVGAWKQVNDMIVEERINGIPF